MRLVSNRAAVVVVAVIVAASVLAGQRAAAATAADEMTTIPASMQPTTDVDMGEFTSCEQHQTGASPFATQPSPSWPSCVNCLERPDARQNADECCSLSLRNSSHWKTLCALPIFIAVPSKT